MLDETVFRISWEMFHQRISLNSVLLLLLVNFVGGFGWNWCMYHCKYQVKPQSSLWFSSTFATTIAHRNHSFHFHQQDISSESKVKFTQASNHCKKGLEAVKLAYANKTKGSITSQKLGSQDFWQMANRDFNKGKSAIPPLFNSLELLSSTSDKTKLFVKNLLMTQVPHYLFSLLLELIWNCIMFL